MSMSMRIPFRSFVASSVVPSSSVAPSSSAVPAPVFPAAPLSALALLSVALLASSCSPPAQEILAGTAIENVSVIDVDAGTVASGRTVVVTEDRIAAVADPDDIILHEDVQRVDGGGGYLIPGLWDMHVHEFGIGQPPALRLYIANGITGVRDMWGTMNAGDQLRQGIADEGRIGPRAVVAGNITDGANPWWPGSAVADSPERARAVVDSLADGGADFIKVYSVLEADAFHAIAQRASERGVPVAGHVPFTVSASDASDAGMKGMTHMFGIVEECSSNDDEVRAERAAWMELRARGESFPHPFFNPDLYRAIVDAADDDQCGALLSRLAANGTWLTPTLTVLRSMASLHDLRDRDDPRDAYMPSLIVDGWKARPPGVAGETAESIAAGDAFLGRQLAVTRMASDAGVGILAGTDTPNPFVYPGFSLHDELGLMVEAGMTPREALAAATTAPARFLGATDSLGSVATGKLADMVLLEANPLEDIAATRRIALVVANGRFRERVALDEMLEAVRRERAGIS